MTAFTKYCYQDAMKVLKIGFVCLNILLLIPQSFDWLAAFHLELLQAILIAV
jgi:hypothetical protein